MFGPQPSGHWTALQPAGPFMHLIPGALYEVTMEFEDFDRVTHPRGERWVYLGSAFLPHDDGLSLFVSLDGQAEWHMRLQWRPEGQALIIDRLADYIGSAS